MMPDKVYRCYVEKKSGFDVAANALQTEISKALGIRISIYRYRCSIKEIVICRP